MKATIGVPKFSELGLLPGLVECLEKAGIKLPTSIQSQVIPSVLPFKHHHLFTAQTGTGKTLAYMLPTLHLLKSQELAQKKPLTMPLSPRALVIVPNRELTMQLEDVMKLFKHNVRLKALGVMSGQKWGIEEKELREGVDLVFGTPDRIEKHIKNGTMQIGNLAHLVVDETDTLLDAGYSKYIKTLTSLDTKFTFVSATFPKHMQDFISKHYSFSQGHNLPYIKKFIEAKTHLNLSHLKHEFIQLKEYDKNPSFLQKLQEIHSSVRASGCMVFCNSIQSARATQHFLNGNGFEAVSLHGEIPPKRRLEYIEKFKSKKAHYLVCTDLASRGLDFPFIKYVIQYDFPKTVSDYVHRAGRTGRAGSSGTVITFYRNKNYPVIKELQSSYEKNKPLNITSSAFSAKNKEMLFKQKQTPQQKLSDLLKKRK